jgi:hypothetical protein
MMGVKYALLKRAVYSSLYRRRKKKTEKIVKAKVWSSDSSAISQSKVLCM